MAKIEVRPTTATAEPTPTLRGDDKVDAHRPDTDALMLSNESMCARAFSMTRQDE
jgi:hypothetical protein